MSAVGVTTSVAFELVCSHGQEAIVRHGPPMHKKCNRILTVKRSGEVFHAQAIFSEKIWLWKGGLGSPPGTGLGVIMITGEEFIYTGARLGLQ